MLLFDNNSEDSRIVAATYALHDDDVLGSVRATRAYYLGTRQATFTFADRAASESTLCAAEVAAKREDEDVL